MLLGRYYSTVSITVAGNCHMVDIETVITCMPYILNFKGESHRWYINEGEETTSTMGS